MALAGTLGARLFFSATPLTNDTTAADAIADFQALTIATEVGRIENVGEFGPLFETVTFVPVGTGVTQKLKGPINYGTLAMVVGQDLTDAGQAALKTRADSLDQHDYPFMISINTPDTNKDTVYFGGKVMSFQTTMGAANTVVRANVRIEITTKVFIGDVS